MALAFSSSNRGGVPTLRFLTSFGEGVVDQHWPGLYEPWEVEPDENPFIRFGVNNNNQEEMAVYQGFAWAITENRLRLAVLHCEGQLVETWFGRSPESWLKWEYFVDSESSDLAHREEGFRKARSTGPSHASGAAAYRIDSRDELRDLVVASLSDAWGELTLFGFENEERLAGALKRMNERAKPNLGALLDGGDRMVHLAFGVDLGHFDSIVVAGRGASEQVARISDRFTMAGGAYERHLPEIGSMPEFLAALKKLREGEV